MKSELCQIPGVGPKMAFYLEQQGIHTLADLPRKFMKRIAPLRVFGLTPAPSMSGGWRSTMRKMRRKTRKN